MPFSINILNNLNHSELLELDNKEVAFYVDKINKLPINPPKEDVVELFRAIPLTKSLNLVDLFKTEMLKKLDRNHTIKDLARLNSLLPNKILWYEESHNTFSEEYLNNLKKEILDPKYLRKTNLSESFKGTYGFDIHFKSEFKDKVIKYFPFFSDYIEKIFSDDISIYYLNALVLGLDANVKNHHDQTLKRYAPDIVTNPVRVSVLYVDVPEMVGGDFILYQNIKNHIFARIKPEKNKLLYFKGNLAHEILGITEVKSAENKYRISLVCEQYQVDSQTLKKFPNFNTNVPRASWFKLGA